MSSAHMPHDGTPLPPPPQGPPAPPARVNSGSLTAEFEPIPTGTDARCDADSRHRLLRSDGLTVVSVPPHRFAWTGTAERQCEDLKVLLAEQGVTSDMLLDLRHRNLIRKL